MDEDEILIGEGVRLDARPASFASRLLAGLIDLAAYYLAVTLFFVVVAVAAPELDDALFQAAGIVALILLFLGVPTAVETLSRGRSLGKMAMGLRIVRDDGGPVRFRHAFTRALVGIVELWLTAGGIALLCSILDRRGRRVGDIFAGTYSIRVRGGQRALPPVQMPPELAVWASRADIRRLPDGVALAARQFLGRSASLHPTSRARMGLDLASQVEPLVSPGPPLGTHPERFLAAVLAERRNRELVIAERSAQSAQAEAVLLHRLPYGVPDPLD